MFATVGVRNLAPDLLKGVIALAGFPQKLYRQFDLPRRIIYDEPFVAGILQRRSDVCAGLLDGALAVAPTSHVI